jgi:hypothetical protein
MPFNCLVRKERQLRSAIGCLKVAGVFDLAKVFLVQLVIHGVLAERGIGILQGQGIPIELDNGLSPRHPFFCIELPSVEARIAKAIEGA